MKSRYRCLCDHSVNMALGAIELYNKPNFPDREQAFTILMTNAWEALLKAKVLKDNRNQLSTLYIRDSKGHFKRTKRTNTPLTIDLLAAADRCQLEPVVRANLEHLYEVRNAATHLVVPSKGLPLLVFTLGLAAIKNYAQLGSDWFGLHLNQYDFYILPLGFSHPFAKLSAIDLSKQPEDIAAIIKSVVEDEEKDLKSDGFFLTCEIDIVLKHAKKITGQADLLAEINRPMSGGKSQDTKVVVRDRQIIELYPYTFTEALARIQALSPDATRNKVSEFIKEQKIKDNIEYSSYSYASEKRRKQGPTTGTQSIYNEDFVKLCATSLNSKE